MPVISHHGGATGVTGSCHRLQIAPDRAFSIITHVHIDHIGRLPYLLAAGYRGPILCSVPSARLLPLVIEDALKIGFTRDRALIERFLEEVHGRLVATETYLQWFEGQGGEQPVNKLPPEPLSWRRSLSPMHQSRWAAPAA